MKIARRAIGFSALGVSGAFLPGVLGGGCAREVAIVGSMDRADAGGATGGQGSVFSGGTQGVATTPEVGAGNRGQAGTSTGVQGGAAGSLLAMGGARAQGSGGGRAGIEGAAGRGGGPTAEGAAGESPGAGGEGTYLVCDRGHADCNADVLDGCEEDLDRSNEHCGRCGNDCLSKLGTCAAGECVYSNAEGGAAGAGGETAEPISSPCAGLCDVWTRVAPNAEGYRVESFHTTADVCYENIGYAEAAVGTLGIVCWEFASGRKLEVNGIEVPCATSGTELTMPERAGGYCVHASEGEHPYAGYVLPLIWPYASGP